MNLTGSQAAGLTNLKNQHLGQRDHLKKIRRFDIGVRRSAARQNAYAYKGLSDLRTTALMNAQTLLLTSILTSLAATVVQSPMAAHAETDLESVVHRGELRAVVINDVLPYAIKTSNGYEGLDMEFLAPIKDELQAWAGKPIKLKTIPVKSIDEGMSALLTDKADIACGVTFSWQRSLMVDYSIPFALGGVRVIAPEGIDGTPDSLVGKTIGVIKGSMAAKTLKAAVPDAKFIEFLTPQEALNAIKTGKIAILGGDSLWLAAYREEIAPTSKLAPAYPYQRAAIGCIMKENNSTMMDYSNIGIAKLLQGYIEKDKTVRAGVNRWIGPESSVGLPEQTISNFYKLILSTRATLQLKPH